jgi:carbon-monoxide dehydrogenase large subunit
MSAHDDPTTWFGASVQRKEDPAFLTGRGRFVDDMQPPGLLHAAILRSPHAHARIRGIDTAAAKALPGVHAVYTFADLPEAVRAKPLPLLVLSAAFKNAVTQYVLARDETRYVGEPVVVVVADSRALAEDAADLVNVDYEPLPAVSDVLDGLKPGAPTAHSGTTSNVIASVPFEHGDADAVQDASRRRFPDGNARRPGAARREHRHHQSVRHVAIAASRQAHFARYFRIGRTPDPRDRAGCRRRPRTQGRVLSGIRDHGVVRQ